MIDFYVRNRRHNNFSKAFHAVFNRDDLIDRIPIASTFKNIHDLYVKLRMTSLPESRSFSYLRWKSYIRCAVLLVPFIGNITVAIYDFMRLTKSLNDDPSLFSRDIDASNYDRIHLLLAEYPKFDPSNSADLLSAVSALDVEKVALLLSLGTDVNQRKRFSEDSNVTPAFYLHLLSSTYPSHVQSGKKDKDQEKIRKIRELLEEADANFAFGKELFLRKWVANTCGIGGVVQASTSEREKEEIELGGLDWRFSAKMHEYIKQFLNENGDLLTDNIKEIIQQSISTALTIGYEDSQKIQEDTMERIRSGLPTMILTGYQEHAAVVICTKKYVIICNRGERPGNTACGIEIRERSEEITEKDFKAIMNPSEQFKDQYKFFNALRPFLALKLVKTIPQKDQEIGNCLVASIKSGIFALIYVLMEDSGIESCKKIYKAFTADLRKRALKEYEEKTHYPDDTLLKDVIDKQGKKNKIAE